MKTAISVELVPRSKESLFADADVAARYPEVTHLNVPDLECFALRSVEAVRMLREKYGDRFVYVPHVRAIKPSFDTSSYSGDIALVVHGDKLATMKDSVATSAEYIALLSVRIPTMAGLDPYRSSLRDELAYVETKRAAGATGFFTQPFFSMDHLRFWDTLLPRDCTIFYGISPVTTEKSLAYWKEKNHVAFPSDFSTTLYRQVSFARVAIYFARQKGRSVYLMPIRTPLAGYLEKVFTP